MSEDKALYRVFYYVHWSIWSKVDYFEKTQLKKAMDLYNIPNPKNEKCQFDKLINNEWITIEDPESLLIEEAKEDPFRAVYNLDIIINPDYVKSNIGKVCYMYRNVNGYVIQKQLPSNVYSEKLMIHAVTKSGYFIYELLTGVLEDVKGKDEIKSVDIFICDPPFILTTTNRWEQLEID